MYQSDVRSHRQTDRHGGALAASRFVDVGADDLSDAAEGNSAVVAALDVAPAAGEGDP